MGKRQLGIVTETCKPFRAAINKRVYFYMRCASVFFVVFETTEVMMKKILLLIKEQGGGRFWCFKHSFIIGGKLSRMELGVLVDVQS